MSLEEFADNMPTEGESGLGTEVETTRRDTTKSRKEPDFSKPPCEGGASNITAICAKHIRTCGNICSPIFYDHCPTYQKEREKYHGKS